MFAKLPSSSSFSTAKLIAVTLATAAAAGLGYYFFIHRPNQQEQQKQQNQQNQQQNQPHQHDRLLELQHQAFALADEAATTIEQILRQLDDDTAAASPPPRLGAAFRAGADALQLVAKPEWKLTHPAEFELAERVCSLFINVLSRCGDGEGILDTLRVYETFIVARCGGEENSYDLAMALFQTSHDLYAATGDAAAEVALLERAYAIVEACLPPPSATDADGSVETNLAALELPETCKTPDHQCVGDVRVGLQLALARGLAHIAEADSESVVLRRRELVASALAYVAQNFGEDSAEYEELKSLETEF